MYDHFMQQIKRAGDILFHARINFEWISPWIAEFISEFRWFDLLNAIPRRLREISVIINRV